MATFTPVGRNNGYTYYRGGSPFKPNTMTQGSILPKSNHSYTYKHSYNDASTVIERKKRIAMDKNRTRVGVFQGIPSSYASANKNTVKHALRMLRGGGAVSPAKKGYYKSGTEVFTPISNEDFNLAIEYYFTPTSSQALSKKGYTIDSIGRYETPTQNAISSWNTSKVTSMASTFLNKSTFNIDISQWDTGLVTTMQQMFSGASAFNQNISKWDVDNVTNMFAMFNSATLFDQDISKWKTGNVTNMQQMFQGATLFNQDISGWDTSNVTDMSAMFQSASAFNKI
jgi:surface protein